MMTLKITTAPIAIPKSILCCFIIFKTEINKLYICIYMYIYTYICTFGKKKKRVVGNDHTALVSVATLALVKVRMKVIMNSQATA